MATYRITFVTGTRDDEEVTAEGYEDKPPFIDFYMWDKSSQAHETVARYRAEDIRRILRED